MNSNRFKRINKSTGFTLIELLVVLAIIGLLAGLVGPQVMKHLGGAKTKTAQTQIEDFSGALDMYRLDVGSYPTTEQGLKALVEKPSNVNIWNGPYLKKTKLPQDPWMKDYIYVSPGQHGKFDIVSLGADGREGGEGEDKDLLSWE